MPAWSEAISRQVFLQHLRDVKTFDSDLKRALRDAATEADSIVRSIVPDSVGPAIRRAQYQQRAYLLRHVQTELFGRTSADMLRHLETSSRLAVRGTMLISEVLARALGDNALGSSFLFSARASVENLRSRLMSRIDLSPRVYKNQALANRWVDRAVNRGILLGKSAREIASDVRLLIRPDTPGGVSYAAQRLGRTELNNAFHETSRRAVEGMPWITGVRWNLSDHGP